MDGWMDGWMDGRREGGGREERSLGGGGGGGGGGGEEGRDLMEEGKGGRKGRTKLKTVMSEKNFCLEKCITNICTVYVTYVCMYVHAFNSLAAIGIYMNPK